jgi:hypothetical protein
MNYYSQVAFAKKTNKPLITIWRWCHKGKIKTETIGIYQSNGKLVQMPLIPETELSVLGY